jgi:hypothetical protein
VGKQFADESATITSIKADGASGGSVSIHGRTKVGNVEEMFKKQYGITVQVENKSRNLADNSISITQATKV